MSNNIKRIVYLKDINYEDLINTGQTSINNLTYIYDKDTDYQVDSKDIFSPLNHTHSLNDIIGVPSIINDSITVRVNGTEVGTFSLNQSTNTTIEVPDTKCDIASPTTPGLIKPFYYNVHPLTFQGSVGFSSTATMTTSTLSNRYYPVGVDSNGRPFVNFQETTSTRIVSSSYTSSYSYCCIEGASSGIKQLRVLSIQYSDSPSGTSTSFTRNITFPNNLTINATAVGIQVLGSSGSSYNTFTAANLKTINTRGCTVVIDRYNLSSAYSGVEILVIGTD